MCGRQSCTLPPPVCCAECHLNHTQKKENMEQLYELIQRRLYHNTKIIGRARGTIVSVDPPWEDEGQIMCVAFGTAEFTAEIMQTPPRVIVEEMLAGIAPLPDIFNKETREAIMCELPMPIYEHMLDPFDNLNATPGRIEVLRKKYYVVMTYNGITCVVYHDYAIDMSTRTLIGTTTVSHFGFSLTGRPLIYNGMEIPYKYEEFCDFMLLHPDYFSSYA